jgi:hypothetical protein
VNLWRASKIFYPGLKRRRVVNYGKWDLSFHFLLPEAISDGWIWASTLSHWDLSHSFLNNFLSTYYVAGSILGVEDAVMNKKHGLR